MNSTLLLIREKETKINVNEVYENTFKSKKWFACIKFECRRNLRKKQTNGMYVGGRRWRQGAVLNVLPKK